MDEAESLRTLTGGIKEQRPCSAYPGNRLWSAWTPIQVEAE